VLAALCAVLGLVLTVAFELLWNLPAGAAGGILAGSMTIPAAIGAAEEAVRQGAMPLPPGARFEDVSGMIALSFGLTYLWATVGIVLICRHVPHWWGLDAKAEAKAHENALGVHQVDEAGLTGYTPLAVRAYRLANDRLTGWTVRHFVQAYPHYTVLNVLRPEPAAERSGVTRPAPLALQGGASYATAGPAGIAVLRDPDATAPPIAAKAERGVLPPTQYSKLGAAEDLAFRQGDIVTIGARIEHHAQGAQDLGPEVGDEAALNVPMDAGAILVTKAQVEGLPFGDLRGGDFARQIAIVPRGARGRADAARHPREAAARRRAVRLRGAERRREVGRNDRPSCPARTSRPTWSRSPRACCSASRWAPSSSRLAGARLGFGLWAEACSFPDSWSRASPPASSTRVRAQRRPRPARRPGASSFSSRSSESTPAPRSPRSSRPETGDPDPDRRLRRGDAAAARRLGIGIHVLKINPAILQGALAGARSHPARGARIGPGKRQQRALDRLPGGLCGLGPASHRLRLRGDGLVEVGCTLCHSKE
jgi:hypothetical protein